jgi:sugar porter (SP) family MFS transporter
MSLVIGTSQYSKYFHDPSGVRQGGITAAMAGGSILGALASGYISNKIGRRDAIFVACIWWMIGTTLQVACNGIAMLIVGRIVNGLCVGITSSQVPVYLAEISKKEKRGSILCIQQWAIEWGMLIMYFLSYGWSFYTATPTGSFRGAWSMQYIPCVFLMMGIPFLPRSPRWLAKVGREAQAIQTLADIQAGGNQRDPLVLAEWEEICTVLEAERAGSSKGLQRFYKNGMWKRTLAGCSAQAWQQLTGANVMTYYIVYVFEMAGLRGNVALYSSGIEYAVFIVGTAVALLIIDRTGRRPLLIYGAISMGVCMFVVGGILGSYGTYLPHGLNGNLDVRITVSGAASYVVIVFSYGKYSILSSQGEKLMLTFPNSMT